MCGNLWARILWVGIFEERGYRSGGNSIAMLLQPLRVFQDKITDKLQTSGENKFLGALAKLQGATISFFVYVRPSVRHCVCSVRVEQLGSHRTDFHEI